jgi:subtilisin family serine protease
MRSNSVFYRIGSLVLVVLAAIAAVPVAVAQGGSGRTITTVEPAKIDSSASIEVIKRAVPRAAVAPDGTISVFIKLAEQSLASYSGGVPGIAATSPQASGKALDPKSADAQSYLAYLNGKLGQVESAVKAAAPGASTTHRFDVILGGVSMRVPASSLDALRKLPGVTAVYVDKLEQLQTDTTPEFLGAPTFWEELGGQSNAGEGMVIGVLDTGIWPEHPSFSDPDPAGKPYQHPIVRLGIPCEFGSATPGDTAFVCNNKIVGAYRFMQTYEGFGPELEPGEFLSARDDDGHGSHTASTAAGNAGVRASIFGVNRGTISGIAPRASIIAYKVCGAAGCYQSDSAAAVQQAISDGVDVINFSISGGSDPYEDMVSLAFLDAYNARVFVAASAGNSGPAPDTTDHREPWTTTVAASTADRAFKNTLTLSGGGQSLRLRGTSLTDGTSGALPVVVPSGDELCAQPAAPGTYTGKIVVCRRGTNGRVEKGYNVWQGGAAGMILYNQSDSVTDLETDNHFLPTTHIQYSQGQQVLAFLAAHPGATASLSAGRKSEQEGDVMASFSSRGGPGQTLGISKPDVTAPGVQILAAHTPMSVALATGPQGEYFQAIAGTSMSSPHVAGAALLLHQLHQDWTPGQIKSALMTTAVTDVEKEDGSAPADWFDFGSGRINLARVADPGLTISAPGEDYVNRRSRLYTSNYPSVYVPEFPGRITLERTLQDVTGRPNRWRVSVDYPDGQPEDFSVSVPRFVTIRAGQAATLTFTIEGGEVPLGEVRFAEIKLTSSRGYRAHIPITIVRKNPATVSATKNCAPATLKLGETTDCAITLQNNTYNPEYIMMFDPLPRQLRLDEDSVQHGFVAGRNKPGYGNTISGVEPPGVSLTALSSSGYVSLASLGAPPNVTMLDETIVNLSTSRPYLFGGKTYTSIGMVSNGYAVVGGGNAADVEFHNSAFPNPERPNGTLAPFWTDLNGSAGGRYYAYVVGNAACSDPASLCWLVMEWENAPQYSDGLANTFQIWIGLNGVEDISYAYGAINGQGDGNMLTVGAENQLGNRGVNYYSRDGITPVIGTLPTSANPDLQVSTSTTAPVTVTVTFSALAVRTGEWRNCAEVLSATFDGVNLICMDGRVTRH